jgi:hypothetical protein
MRKTVEMMAGVPHIDKFILFSYFDLKNLGNGSWSPFPGRRWLHPSCWKVSRPSRSAWQPMGASVWESPLPTEVLRLPEDLARVDAPLDDPVFCARSRRIFSQYWAVVHAAG